MTQFNVMPRVTERGKDAPKFAVVRAEHPEQRRDQGDI